MHVTRVVSVSSLLLLVACSDPATSSDGGAVPVDAPSEDGGARDAGGEVNDGAVLDGSVDAGAVHDGAVLDGSVRDASTVASRGGLVSLTQVPGSAGATQHVLFGYFTEATIDQLRSGVVAGCTTETSGACQRIVCGSDVLGASDDAGELRAEVGARTLTATVSAPTGRYLGQGDGAVFAPGDRVSFEVTGGEVPAFAADVVAPDAPTVALPATLAVGAPLTITWSATTAETMQLTLAPFAGGGVIGCRVPASDRELTVDASLLDHLSAGGMVSLVTSAFTTHEVVAGDYAVDVSVAQASSGTATVE